MTNNPTLYESRDQVEFARLRIAAIEPHDIATLKDGTRWTVLRLLPKRDARGNLRYACQNSDGDGDSHSINMFTEIMRPDITPASAAAYQEEAQAVVKGPDFTIRDEGTIVQFIPNTDAAKEWLDAHVASEEWQWLGRGLCVEHRYAPMLRDKITEDGFTVEP